MKNAYNYASIILAALTLSGCAQSGKETAANSAAEAANPEVVAIYYPHWHVYPCGEKWFGKGWTEWEFVKSGKPRFKGHKYTLRPMAGYLDGAKPEDVEKEIEIASNAGIGTFLFDWYWYGGKMTMQESLEKGFFGAKNFGKMKFAIMWANHDRLNQFRPDIDKPREMLMKIARTPEDFFAAIDYCADNYFNKPNYWRVNGKLFFSIFKPEFVDWNGGPEKVKKMLAQANEKMKAKGLPPVHWNAMTFEPAKADKLKAAGFDSVTSYGIVSTPKELKTKFADNPFIDDYSDTATFHRATWEEMRKRKIPYIPNVTRGWDSSLRCKLDEPFPYRKREYPYGRTVVNNRVDIFEGLLRDAKTFAKTTGANAVLINAWNEYTEGSYLMPSDADCDASLRAVAAVFGRNPKGRYAYVDRQKGEIFNIPAPTYENLSYGASQKNKIDGRR